MYAAIRSLGPQKFAYAEFLPFIVALVLAELFYKFGSFTLEVIAFVPTWWILGFAFARLYAALGISTQ
ncbi:hypothetical protein [Mesorhizobium sp. M0060]|uniref:hypothetical protein n=1 Tax=Mesorhizobium sp. M0060 TaxID=2956866 RepID=UPI00333E126C